MEKLDVEDVSEDATCTVVSIGPCNLRHERTSRRSPLESSLLLFDIL